MEGGFRKNSRAFRVGDEVIINRPRLSSWDRRGTVTGKIIEVTPYIFVIEGKNGIREAFRIDDPMVRIKKEDNLGGLVKIPAPSSISII